MSAGQIDDLCAPSASGNYCVYCPRIDQFVERLHKRPMSECLVVRRVARRPLRVSAVYYNLIMFMHKEECVRDDRTPLNEFARLPRH